MYEEYFSLHSKPFELVPNPGFLFLSGTHRRALNYLQYGFDERAGFILLTGDIGAGKTTLLRELVARLEGRAVISRIFNTKVDPTQLLGMIATDFGLEVSSGDKIALLRSLNDFLIECYRRDDKPLLIIDEAQNLSSETLEEVRLLSNLESSRDKLLQIILVGQPELQSVLNQDSLEQLRQRLSVSCHLGTLTPDETREYFFHRLECAGNAEAVSIPDEAFAQIHTVCRGVPRLINIFGDYLLLAAYSDQCRELSPDFIDEVLREVRTTVAFIGPSAGARRGARHDGAPQDREQLAAWHEVRDKQQRYEEVLKKIIRKQSSESERIRQRLDAIGASLQEIERELKEALHARVRCDDKPLHDVPTPIKKVQ